ncbi:MBL fold metallo-hydrolase [Frigoriglobus tundricola]|uniref:MBL-fold metallo-hydrolase superfamily n=1 Tax=Frigoriglobus tundricola TaxID=2774151 RepID=A0A6M5YW39_9BACT|nr:MBL fold metallo-hydrolase [Frigoriglobus tundricola]QJW97423.1 MBL-fold metallo-hydrolase superfamily [Frigoriglobus tundricola]
MSVQILTIESQPFAENSYLVWNDGGTEAFVIDPGFEPELIVEALDERGLTLVAIVCTHGHCDHIAGNAALKRAYPTVPIIIGAGDAVMLTDAMKNLSGPFGFDVTSPPADRTVTDGEALTVAGITMDVGEIPGHSPGHVVYALRDTKPTLVLGGDVLFRGGVGRTDFPGGSFAQLKAGIRRVLWPLPDDTVVYPGHGPTTTTGHEKRTNAYLAD